MAAVVELGSALALAVEPPLVIDGVFADWEGALPTEADASRDTRGAIDLGRLWLAHDDRHLFVRFETGADLVLQEQSGLVLLVDGDDDPRTGRRAGAIGADLEWDFGARAGRVVTSAGAVTIGQAELGLVVLPSHASAAFELSLPRTARPAGRALFAGPRIRLRLEDRSGGDSLPDGDGGALYDLGGPARHPPPPLAAARAPGRSLRIVAWSLEHDALFDAVRQQAIGRILRALAPDVLGLQEIYDHDAADVTLALAKLDASDAPAWHAEKHGMDLVVATRLPIEAGRLVHAFEDYGAVAAWLVDSRRVLGRPLLLVLSHLTCCRGGPSPTPDEKRQRSADATAAFLRDARHSGGMLAGNPDAALVVAGDLNMVGEVAPLLTLLNGTIADRQGFGTGRPPGPDGLPLRDLVLRHTHAPHASTWRKAASKFPPSRLDFALTTGSQAASGFVFDSAGLPELARAALGVQATDSEVASDHLPLVVDVEAQPLDRLGRPFVRHDAATQPAQRR